MSVNVFPAPSTGGGGGGSGLPEGAVSQVIQGKLTPTGYTHPEVLDAGTYLMNANGNAVIVDLPNSGTTQTVSGSGTLTLTSNESNLAMTLAENFGGSPVALQGPLPQPTISGYSNVYCRGMGLAVDPVNGNLALTRMYWNTNTVANAAIRNEYGFVKYTVPLSGDDFRFSGTAIDLDGNYFVGYKIGTAYRILKRAMATGVISYPYVDTTWFTNGSGPAGIAVSGDGQTITMVGYNEAKAVTSVNGGSTWTNVNLPVAGFTDTTWASSKVKWQNGRFFARTGTAGQFLTSTDGLTWNAYTIPGASGAVTGFAYDGVTFMFATNNTNLLWRTTSLGSYSSVSTIGGASNGITHVEFGNGKFLATQTGSSTSGSHFISIDDGVSFAPIDSSTTPYTYGNKTGKTNLHVVSPTTTTGVGINQLQQNLIYDPLYKTFVSNNFYTNQTAQYVMDLINVDSNNYYKWIYNFCEDNLVSTTARDLIWSSYMDRYYYGGSDDRASGTRLTFSYDPITGNVRTEPTSSAYAEIQTVWTGNQNNDNGSTLIMPNGRKWTTWQYGTQSLLWYETLSDPAEFWGAGNAAQQSTSTNWDINTSLSPFIFPDGSACMLNGNTNLTNYLQSFVFNAAGNVSAQWYWSEGTIGPQLALAITGGNIVIDTATSTFYCYRSVYTWNNIPYPLPNLSTSTAYRTTNEAGTAFYYKKGDTIVRHNTTTDTVTVSFDNGFTSNTYDSLVSIQGIIEKQGVFYLLTSFGGSTAVATTTDFIGYKLLFSTGISEVYPLFESKNGEPNSLESNPAIMDSMGRIVQLFSEPGLQPDANVFVYDMNLQEL